MIFIDPETFFEANGLVLQGRASDLERYCQVSKYKHILQGGPKNQLEMEL